MKLLIKQGATLTQIVRWETAPLIYKTITAISKAAPVSITSAAHGVPNGWRVAVQSVVGMKQINAANDPPKAKDYRLAAVNNANALTLDGVNSLGYSAYVSGGVLVYATPADLAGFTARLQIRKSIPSTAVLVELTTTNGGIVLDNVDKTIKLFMTATATAALSFITGVYALEMISATGTVTSLLEGAVLVSKEVTR